MKAYLIDAAARTITPIDYEYGDFEKYLPGGICIGHVFVNEDVLYVDDEGLLRKAERAFRIKDRRDGQPMMSNGILTGRDSDHTGTEADTTLPPAFSITELAERIEWLSVDEAMAWFWARSEKPAVTTVTGDGTEAVIAHWSDFVRSLEGQAEADRF